MSTFLSSAITLAKIDPVAHVVNHGFTYSDNGIWLWSAHVGNLVLSGIICIVVGMWAAKQVATGPEELGNDRYITKNPFAHMLEVIAVYLRNDVVRPMLGHRTDKFMPFLWSLFFFILVNNLLGLIPILDVLHLVFPSLKEAHAAPVGGTATQNIGVTFVLAIICGFVFNLAGLKELGLKEYIKHQTGGVPLTLAYSPIVVGVFFIEVFGNFVIKPGALAIRLFANMTAGHILVATLFAFIGAGVKLGLVMGTGVVLASALGVTAVYFLELFVAFLQAFVFMFLTTVFISLLAHQDDHSHEHEPEHAPA